ncbi:hypothetical protein [Streptomyces sp. NPDC007100]|uniref:hypothetical protein n=1 Tax=Streptomyces sp. NPDC007100 TaxID=3155602 RepID=UPI0033E01F3C
MRLISLAGVLLGPLARAVDWTPVLATAVVSLGTAAATAPCAVVEPDSAAVTLRLAGVLLGAAAGFALVDVAAAATTATPVPRWLRQWIRTLLVTSAAAAAWAATFLVLAARTADGTQLRASGLATEAAVCLFGGLACTAVAVRRRPERLAAVTGAAALLTIAVSTLPCVEDVWPYLGNPRWDDVHLAWLTAGLVPLPALAVAHREVRT